MIRWILLFLCLAVTGPMPAAAQQQLPDATMESTEAAPRAETGGATTLEDILRRQRGENVDLGFRADEIGNPDDGPTATGPLGTLGGASDPELWRALRYGEAAISSQVRSPGSTLLVQDSGMAWLKFRAGPLREWGGYFLLGVIAFLALFYLIRGRIRIGAGHAGVTVERFKFIERFAHWLLAGSFLLLAFTGLLVLFGRVAVIPLFDMMGSDAGHQINSTIAIGSKWIHNNVSWAFMIALVMIFVMWVLHNIPNRHDLNWIAKGGGIIGGGHPPAKKFNAGQKIIFWSVILLGISISASGLELLFPFELHLFEKTFGMMRGIGITELPVYGPLPETLTPHAEMQHAQIWHAMVSFILMGIIIAHIYIGTLGMEGAYDAMGSGEVDLNWAKEHHSLWVEEEIEKGRAAPHSGGATPAE